MIIKKGQSHPEIKHEKYGIYNVIKNICNIKGCIEDIVQSISIRFSTNCLLCGCTVGGSTPHMTQRGKGR